MASRKRSMQELADVLVGATVEARDEMRDSLATARTEGAKAERDRIVAIVDAHLADLRTAQAASERDASPYWTNTIRNIIDSVSVLRGRIENHEPKESGDG